MKIDNHAPSTSCDYNMVLVRKRPSKSSVNKQELLRNLIPLNTLDSERLDELARHAFIESLPANTKIFKRGDTDSRAIYLLDGELDLINPEKTVHISSSSEEARLAIDPQQPHQYTAICKAESQILILEKNLLDVLLTWDPYAGYIVDEIDGSTEIDYDDWMLATLQSEVFQHIPPAKIQSMFQMLEPLTVQKDEIIFRQGDKGDYFYIIQSGRCSIIRERDNNKEIIVELGQGATFGEDALLSNSPRNATIKMLTEGRLLRLSMEDFTDLFQSNIVVNIDMKRAHELNDENAIWIDVRQPEEFSKKALPYCINIPLPEIRESLGRISNNQPCIICCDTGQRSACAAYILCALGYEAYALQDGLQSNIMQQ